MRSEKLSMESAGIFRPLLASRLVFEKITLLKMLMCSIRAQVVVSRMSFLNAKKSKG
jgi:hypothetical protein